LIGKGSGYPLLNGYWWLLKSTARSKGNFRTAIALLDVLEITEDDLKEVYQHYKIMSAFWEDILHVHFVQRE